MLIHYILEHTKQITDFTILHVTNQNNCNGLHPGFDTTHEPEQVTGEIQL